MADRGRRRCEAFVNRLVAFVVGNGLSLAVASGGIALGYFGLPHIPRSLCVTLGFLVYVGAAFTTQNLVVGLVMTAGLPAWWACEYFWSFFVAIDDGDQDAIATNALGCIFSYSAAAAVGGVRWYVWQEEHGDGMPDRPEPHFPSRRTSLLAHSRFSETAPPTVSSTDI